MISTLVAAGILLLAAQGLQTKLLDIDCAGSICEQECTQCALIGDHTVEDCLALLPQGCPVTATIAQSDLAPLYTCFRPHVGRGIALPFLTIDAEASLVLINLARFRQSCTNGGASTTETTPIRGGILNKQEMKTCSLGPNEYTESLPHAGGASSLYIDLSHAVMRGQDSDYIQILDSCSHEEDKISIAMMIETGTLQGLGTSPNRQLSRQSHLQAGTAGGQTKVSPAEIVVFSCPAPTISSAFVDLRKCPRSIELRLSDDASTQSSATTLLFRLRQLLILLLVAGMIYMTYLYGIALRLELKKSAAAREVVRDAKYISGYATT